jgi:hypothetical protein
MPFPKGYSVPEHLSSKITFVVWQESDFPLILNCGLFLVIAVNGNHRHLASDAVGNGGAGIAIT